MPTGLKRYYGRGHLHFLTFSCYNRLPFLKTEFSKNLFVNELARVRTEYGFPLEYVVMPEHVHLLAGEPKKGTVSTMMQMLKQRVSRKMRILREAELREEAPAFWMERFYDFNVYNEKKIKEKLEYMHANPIARGLVERQKDWPWSSWNSAVKGEKGLIEIDSWR
jgi:REP-associated tyrosine transposase